MKKFLFALAAVAVMVACGGEKEKTPEQRAEEFAQRAVTLIQSYDFDGLEKLKEEATAYHDTLDEETAKVFEEALKNNTEDLIMEAIKDNPLIMEALMK